MSNNNIIKVLLRLSSKIKLLKLVDKLLLFKIKPLLLDNKVLLDNNSLVDWLVLEQLLLQLVSQRMRQRVWQRVQQHLHSAPVSAAANLQPPCRRF